MNKLISEESSYLKQAANQPINWLPWSDEAFQKAKSEDKPILLSIGASWCHWCHVMAKESFEDKETAEFINNNFIAIKVDRDERPDIDKVYQNFVQALVGVGGWPLNVFMTPEKEAFYGGTYFPPTDGRGMPSFMSALSKVLSTYKNNKQRLVAITNEIKKAMETGNQLQKSGKLEFSAHQKSIENILGQIDPINGGFGSSPKFFMAETLLLLLDYFKANKNSRQAKWMELTLKKMADGGVYDQIGGGFHRYSTDASWTIPHFEKLLTDNSMMARVYFKAYQIFGKEEYKKTGMEILEYILREMADPSGLFYSSQDADAENEEGGYFTWPKKEVVESLGEKESKIISMHYGILGKGNYGHEGKNILSVQSEPDDIANVLKLSLDEIRNIINMSRKILLEKRSKRERPFTDKNVFTGWNALCSSAFLDGYKVTGEKKYLDAAVKNMDSILDKIYRGGVLYHMYSIRSGKAYVTAFLDDFVFLGQALVDLYQTNFGQKYLKLAEELTKKMVTNFWDSQREGFTYTAKHRKEAGNEERPFLDFSLPGANSAAISLLLDLYHLTDEKKYMDKAEILLRLFFESNPNYDLHKATYLQALEYYFKPYPEFVLVGDFSGPIVKEFVAEINKRLPRKLLHIGLKNAASGGKKKIDGKPTVYLCYNNACSMPITDLDELKKELDKL